MAPNQEVIHVLDGDDDDLTLDIAHFPEISPAVKKQPTKSVSMEENKIVRAPQYQYTRERYERAPEYHPESHKRVQCKRVQYSPCVTGLPGIGP